LNAAYLDIAARPLVMGSATPTAAGPITQSAQVGRITSPFNSLLEEVRHGGSKRKDRVDRSRGIHPGVAHLFDERRDEAEGRSEVMQGMDHLGLPATLILPLAIVEISCVVIYLIPKTSVVGAILLTGFIGGAICAHLRVGDPFYLQIVIGMVIWLGLYLREDRLRGLMPLRTL
jgi:DoxX-like protein